MRGGLRRAVFDILKSVLSSGRAHDGVGFRVGRRLVCSTAPHRGVGRGNHLRGGQSTGGMLRSTGLVRRPSAAFADRSFGTGVRDRRAPPLPRSAAKPAGLASLHVAATGDQGLYVLGAAGTAGMGFLDEWETGHSGSRRPTTSSGSGSGSPGSSKRGSNEDAHPSSPCTPGLSDVRPTFSSSSACGNGG